MTCEEIQTAQSQNVAARPALNAAKVVTSAALIAAQASLIVAYAEVTVATAADNAAAANIASNEQVKYYLQQMYNMQCT